MAFDSEAVDRLAQRIGSGEFLFDGEHTQDSNEKWRNVRFVNAYAVTQGYGGPEEGGWYFTIGEPLASIPVSNSAQAMQAAFDLRARFGEEYSEYAEAYSATNDGMDLNICVENKFAEPYPDEIPHYE